MNALETAWDRVAALSPNPPAWVVQLAALIAVIIVLEPHLWRIARNVVTIAHEGAHLIVAVLVGRRLKGLRLHSDTSGVAISSGKPTDFGVILMTFAGYVGPSILGLGAAGLLGAQRAVSVLWIGVFVIAVMMVLIRNLYGVFSLAVVGARVVRARLVGDPGAASGRSVLPDALPPLCRTTPGRGTSTAANATRRGTGLGRRPIGQALTDTRDRLGRVVPARERSGARARRMVDSAPGGWLTGLIRCPVRTTDQRLLMLCGRSHRMKALISWKSTSGRVGTSHGHTRNDEDRRR